MSLLSVENLTLQFKTDEGLITAVDNVSFSLEPGEIMGLVGESGSGKSVTAKSIMKLNPGNAVYDPASKILLEIDGAQIDVMALSRPREMQVVRGGAVSMIFQEPMASFAPAITIGDQMVEQLLLAQRRAAAVTASSTSAGSEPSSHAPAVVTADGLGMPKLRPTAERNAAINSAFRTGRGEVAWYNPNIVGSSTAWTRTSNMSSAAIQETHC